MARKLTTWCILAVLVMGLLAPKVSAVLFHLNPNIMSVVICTGTELVTIQIGPDGQPVEVPETDQSSCLLADPNTGTQPAFVQWTQAPRSYRGGVVDLSHSLRSQAELGLLPDLRGPPFVI